LLALLLPLVLLLSLSAASAPEASALPENFFGLMPAGGQVHSESDLEAAARSGAKYWRIGFNCFEWLGHESTVWHNWDIQVELAWKHGLMTLPTLESRCAAVTSELPARQEWEGAGSAWENFVKAVVEHYGYLGSFWNGKENKKEIGNWEIQNEPNLSEHGVDGYASGKIYAEFFKRTSEILHAAQGSFFTANALVGGMWYGDLDQSGEKNKTPHDFMQEMSTYAPVAFWINGVAIHPYEFGENAVPRTEEDITQARLNVNQFFGSDKTLWITEVGWPTEGHGEPGFPATTLESQVDALRHLFDWVKLEQPGKNIQSLIFYMYRDYNWNGHWDSFCGLRNEVLPPPSDRYAQTTFRPAWYTYQEETGATRWPVQPGAETLAATGVTATEATLNGTVNPHGLPTGYRFEYGLAGGEYTTWVPSPNTEAGWEEKNWSESYRLTGLQPNTTYHYRIVATNENKEMTGATDRTFKTSAQGYKFSTPASWGSWPSAYSLSLADVNGDGKADAIGRNSSNDVQVGLSSGNGFPNPTTWTSWNSEYGLKFGDVNGDGKADLVGKNSSTGDVQVGLSTGSSFATSTSWATLPSSYSIELGDVNGDGKADAVGMNTAGEIQVGLSTGSKFGTTASWGTWPSGFAWPTGNTFVLGDVNGDGKADVIARNGTGELKVGLSTGSSFAAATTWLSSSATTVVKDVNGDGKADALGRNTADELQVGLSTGSSFAVPAKWGTLGTEYATLQFADVNGDGPADVVGKNSAGELQVGLAMTPNTAEKLNELAITEPFNGSGESTANFNAKWSVLSWASGKGTDTTAGWGPTSAYPTVNGAYYNTIVSDPGSGSGAAAIATMASSPVSAGNYFSVWLDMPSSSTVRRGYELRFTYASAGTYTVTLSKWVSGTQTVLATKSSYSFANGSSFALLDQGGTVSAWTNTGSGFSQLLSASDATFSSGNAGLEGAGESTRLTNFKAGSLLWTGVPPSPPSPQYRYMLGTSAGTSIGNWGFALTGKNQPLKMDVGDVTGDGKADVVAVESEGGGNYRYMLGTSNGSGIGSWVQILAGMNNPDKIAVGDVTGDGKADIVAVEQESGGNYRYMLGTSNGSGIGSWTTLLTGMSHPTFMDLGDVTGDGKADIVAVEQESGGNYRYMLGTSKGTSISWGFTSLTNMSGPWQMAVGDITGDKKADVVTVEDAGGGSFRYMLGTSTGSNFTWGYLLTGMSAPYRMTLGDVNGDGKADIVADESEGGGKFRYMFGISTGSTISPWGYALTGLSSQEGLGVGDVTGDGKADVVGVEAY
jgi:hypothetical protein